MRWPVDDWPNHITSGPATAGTAFSDRFIAARHRGSSNEIWFLEPMSPSPRWIKPPGLRGRYFSIQDLAFVADNLAVLEWRPGNNSISIIDIGDGSLPFELGSTWIPFGDSLVGGREMALAFDWLGKVVAIDLQNPAVPVVHDLTWQLRWDRIHQLRMVGRTAVGVVQKNQEKMLVEVDFSIPSSPRVIASQPHLGDILAATERFVITTSSGASQLTVHEKLGDLAAVGQTPIAGNARSLAADGSLAVVANGWAGLMTLDISAPELPRRIAEIDLRDNARAVDLRDSTAVVLLDNTLATIDVSNPADPIVLDSISIDSNPLWHGGGNILEMDGAIALVGSQNPGAITLIDTSNSSSLVRLSERTFYESYIDEIKVLNHIAFVVAGFWLYIIDITDPSHPIDLYDRPSQYSTAIDFQGGFAFLGVQSRVDVLDITEPSHPEVVQSYDDLQAGPLDTVSEDLLAGRGWGDYLADFSDLDSPLIYNTPLAFRWWTPGALLGTTWIRPSAHIIDVMTIECRPPEAEIRTAGRGPTIWFEDLSRYQVTARTWDFGDGETSSALNPIHTYADPGNYTVTLTVSSPNGADTATEILKVGPVRVRSGSRRH